MNHLWRVNSPTNSFPSNISLVDLIWYTLKRCIRTPVQSSENCAFPAHLHEQFCDFFVCLFSLLFSLVGGSEPFRSYWATYLSRGLLLIFVVDSADHSRLPEAKKHLHQLIETNPIIPLVVFANKQVKSCASVLCTQ